MVYRKKLQHRTALARPKAEVVGVKKRDHARRATLHFTRTGHVAMLTKRPHYNGNDLSTDATRMSVLRNVIIAISAISLITFVALFGQLPALRKTPIGLLQRVLCIHIPTRLHAIDKTVTGGQVTNHGKSIGNYLFYEKNPIVLVSIGCWDAHLH